MTIQKKLTPLKTVPKDKAHAAAFYREMEIDTLARTLWGEARGEGVKGMEAVACVILNRVAVSKDLGRYWWGNTIIQVCQKPYQFSCWNKRDPNYPKLITVDAKDLHFASALRIARRAVVGVLKDATKGATHYHAFGISPNWARKEYLCAQIGHHKFYKLI